MSFEFDFTQEKLSQLLPTNPYAQHWFSALNDSLPDYDITTGHRVAAFMAQTMHESGDYHILKENLNYKAESLVAVFPHYFPNINIALQYAHQPEKIANRVYANRMGNGDESSGDGYRYCGRGLIQITGKDNYSTFADSISTPLEQIPEFLTTFEGAVQSACWFWEQNNLNRLADVADIKTMTRVINGGYIGLQDRIDHYNFCIHVLGL